MTRAQDVLPDVFADLEARAPQGIGMLSQVGERARRARARRRAGAAAAAVTVAALGVTAVQVVRQDRAVGPAHGLRVIDDLYLPMRPGRLPAQARPGGPVVPTGLAGGAVPFCWTDAATSFQLCLGTQDQPVALSVPDEPGTRRESFTEHPVLAGRPATLDGARITGSDGRVEATLLTLRWTSTGGQHRQLRTIGLQGGEAELLSVARGVQDGRTLLPRPSWLHLGQGPAGWQARRTGQDSFALGPAGGPARVRVTLRPAAQPAWGFPDPVTQLGVPVGPGFRKITVGVSEGYAVQRSATERKLLLYPAAGVTVLLDDVSASVGASPLPPAVLERIAAGVTVDAAAAALH